MKLIGNVDKPAAGSTTGLKIHTSHLDEERGPFFGSVRGNWLVQGRLAS